MTSEVLHTQARSIVAAVIQYFYEEKNNMGPLKDVRKVLERVSDATKVPKRTVERINAQLREINKRTEIEAEVITNENNCLASELDEANLQASTSTKKRRVVIKTPRKNTKGTPKRRPVTGLDSFQLSAIKRHVLEYYERREVPTLKKLQSSLKERGLFGKSESSLRSILTKIGFVYKKFNGRKVLMEKPSVALLRCQFLRKVRSVDLEKVIFLDETWLNENTAKGSGWTDGTVKGTLNSPLGKGKRLIVCHAGGANGWINAPPLVFQSKKTNDYHEEMNAEIFEGWFFNVLIPAIPPGSTIIMDNAPYHSRVKDKAPTTSSRKGEMIDWLKKKNIPYPIDAKKPELYDLVRIHKPRLKTYEIDSKASSQGFKILRLPPYHCQYNAIEMVWSALKGYVKDRNTTFKLKDIEKLFMEAVSAVTPEKWASYVRHVKKIVDDDWKSEGLSDRSVQELIINLCPGDSDDSTEEDSDSDEEDIGCNLLD
jgi:transposase